MRQQLKISPKWEANSHQSPSNLESPKQDTPKTKHPKTLTTQINRDQRQRTNINSSKGKTTHKWIPIRITADLSIELFRPEGNGRTYLKVMKEKNLQPRLLYPARISFKYEGQIKSFTDKQKRREFKTTKSALQQMLKDLL